MKSWEWPGADATALLHVKGVIALGSQLIKELTAYTHWIDKYNTKLK